MYVPVWRAVRIFSIMTATSCTPSTTGTVEQVEGNLLNYCVGYFYLCNRASQAIMPTSNGSSARRQATTPEFETSGTSGTWCVPTHAVLLKSCAHDLRQLSGTRKKRWRASSQ